MTINRTTLLDLPLPVTGTESGTWGDIVNNGLSEYIDISVAGSLSLSADSDTNLSSTEGNAAGTNIGSTTAQYAILRCTGSRTATRNINAPAWAISGGTLTNYSKIYIVVNETTGSQNIVLRATDSATPTYTTGVTIVPGERAVCAWNGSDFVKVGGAAGGSTTQIQFNNAGVFGGSANLTWDGTNVQIGATGALRLADTDSSNYVAFKSPGTVASNVTWTLPSADGTNGQALTTNGSGTLAFSSVTTSPGGSNTQVQYNNAGAFGGSANFVWDNSNVRLGIGTSSPGTYLEVASPSGSGSGQINIHSPGGGGIITKLISERFGPFRISAEGGSGSGITFETGNSVTPVERMRIDSSGNVGIGTTPSYKLHVNGVTYADNFRVPNTTGFFYDIAGQNGLYIYGTTHGSTPNTLSLNTNGSERMRINSSGNVGIGTSSPSQKLEVSAAGAAAIRVSSSDGTSAALELVRVGAGGDYRFRNAGGVLYLDYGTDDSSFATLAAQFSSGGAIGVGTNAASSGSGITFPATQSASSNANTLDDYEEGTWTPTIEGTSTAGTASYSVQNGRYTKIGRVVQIECYVQWSSGTGTGNIRLSGLPFTCNNDSTFPQLSASFDNLTLTAGNYMFAYVNNNATSIAISQNPTGGGSRTSVAYDAAAEFLVAGTYSI